MAGDDVMNLRYNPIDGGYAWVVVAVSFFICTCTIGSHSSIGVYIVEWTFALDISPAIVQVIMTLRLSMAGVSAVVWNPVLRRVDWRVIGVITHGVNLLSYTLIYVYPSVPMLIVCYGVLTSMMNDIAYMTSFAVINSYFHKRIALANAIFMSGAGFGIFLWPPLIQLLIDTYSWSGAILITAAITLHGMPLMMLFRPITRPPVTPRDDTFEPPDIAEPKIRARVWPSRCLIFFAHIFFILNHVFVISQTPVRAHYMGLSKQEGAYILSVFGLTALACRIPMGLICDQLRRHVSGTLLLAIAILVYGSTFLLSILGTTFITQIIFSAVTGCISAMAIVLIGVAFREHFGVEHITMMTSAMYLSASIGTLCIVPLTGWMLASGQGVSVVVAVFGCGGISAGVMSAAAHYTKSCLDTSSTRDDIPLNDVDTKLTVDT